MEKPVQYFSDEYLKQASACSPVEVVRFLEDIRLISASTYKPAKSILISLKVPEKLLSAFKTRCSLQGIKYQTKIKELMTSYLTDQNGISSSSNDAEPAPDAS